MPHPVHIVGSVPLANAEAVFATIGAALGDRAKRIPDGETGERLTWLGWLEPVFARNPALEISDDLWRVHEQAKPQRRYRLKPGRSVADIRFDALGYEKFVSISYGAFCRLRDSGVVRPGTKFQVAFAPAHSAVRAHVVDSLFAGLEPLYNDAIRAEVARIAAVIPHRDLAIQFDVASAVFAVLQRGDFQAHGGTKTEAAANFSAILASLGNSVPADIDLLFHFCYGDNNHRHSVEPQDMADMADMANRLRHGIARTIQLVHMPVPRDRSDDAYFAPLQGLELDAGTEIALGLVHLTDGMPGTRRRLETARKYLKGFAIATECGFGRRNPETIPNLLRLHAEVAALD